MLNTSPSPKSHQETLDMLAKIESWTLEPIQSQNAILGTPETIRRLCEIAASRGITTEEVLSHALAALEAFSEE